MTYLNARTKNIGNNEGDVYKYFTDYLANLIQKNGGNHYFNWKTYECTESTVPLKMKQKTYLRLTTENFPITQFEKSFISCILEFYVKTDKILDISEEDDPNKLLRVFVGLKNSAEFFTKLDTLCNDVLVKNTQDQAIREQFAYNSIKSKQQKATAKFSHSAWSNVSEFSESVCGEYIPLVDIADGLPHKFTIELTIPYTDFLKYQAFTLYPNSIVGELKELVQASTEGFVWAPIDPSVVKDKIEDLEDVDITEELPNKVKITRKFTQIGNPATIISSMKSNKIYEMTIGTSETFTIDSTTYHGNELEGLDEFKHALYLLAGEDENMALTLGSLYDFKVYNTQNCFVKTMNINELSAKLVSSNENKMYVEDSEMSALGLAPGYKLTWCKGSENEIKFEYDQVSLNITDATITQLRTNIAGFDIKPEVGIKLHEYLSSHTIMIPSQTFERRYFPTKASANGIDATTDLLLNNTTNITVVFPKRSNDATCFDNIMYENVQLSVNKHQFPDTALQTVGARFYQMMLVANELDGDLQATKEFEDSFTDPLNDLRTGKRYTNTQSDGTSFGINFQLERSNAGYVFDGLNSSSPVPVNFRGQPMFKNENDTYYNFDPNDSTQHPPPPELWICKDTHWRMDAEYGLVWCDESETPIGYD